MGKLSAWLWAFPLVYPFIELIPRSADGRIVRGPAFLSSISVTYLQAYLDWRKPDSPLRVCPV